MYRRLSFLSSAGLEELLQAALEEKRHSRWASTLRDGKKPGKKNQKWTTGWRKKTDQRPSYQPA
jgi:hypothetical protein